jgi:hypothetical protein
VKIKEQKMVGLTVVEGDVIRAYDFKPMQAVKIVLSKAK